MLGVFTGVFAYYLYETNPRTAPAERDRLIELIKWKRAKVQREEEQRAAQEEETLKSLVQVEKA